MAFQMICSVISFFAYPALEKGPGKGSGHFRRARRHRWLANVVRDEAVDSMSVKR
jgi:hypothetical protein